MATAQASHLLQRHPKRRVETWSKGLLLQIWDISFNMWEHRNNILHGDNLTPAQASEHDTMRQGIRDEFAKGAATLLPIDRYRLHEDCKHWTLTLSYSKTKLWLDTVRLSRTAHAALQALVNTQLARQQQSMRDWLNTAAPASN